MEEVQHLITLLESAKIALKEDDILTLKNLSNQTIHSASTIQDTGSISIAVLIYTYSKLIERRDHMKIKNWEKFVTKTEATLSLAILALEEKKFDRFIDYLEKLRQTINSISVNLKPYIQDVVQRASLNKASRIYEHGISLERTAKLLGVSQWELSEYTGNTKAGDTGYNVTIDARKRAKMALEFFS